jgi:hypothetical protein
MIVNDQKIVTTAGVEDDVFLLCNVFNDQLCRRVTIKEIDTFNVINTVSVVDIQFA